jgi:hypothetical protein
MSQKKRNAPKQPTWDEIKISVPADGKIVLENCVPFTPKADEYHGKPALHEALELVQHARELEVSRGRTAALPEGCFPLQRLLIAVLESMTPEQRAEVKRRLG